MKFYARNEKDLINISSDFLELMKEYKCFAFNGEMGVGKTTFISYLVKAMGIVDQVSSPTYGYVNEYESPFFGTVYHFDLYRIEDESEAYDIGIEEYIYRDNVVFIEWAEKIENLLPEDCVWINITKDDLGGRTIETEI
ncbi:tRNA (adenosine(37)-N6)-threonylcarbamoyltransferase complex ATPase subunit type 1 TsaE [Brumimicrobium aurantiacum]|uniref:tRNA threonylcarbamoyladenosine biosynthesis protein TsaE n=1 Tax=Brumimicrobium aurantiacum TaxID=1737063 RepID=A0A3E1EW90_9FLAO|nr:tRNA (adenosine(37)-N6)-threonylcarbamoyltransferase complex ATPase subunit type 1 TsaE [Brumimicrobium aurantiacum]RFC53826.1 tRNA (adenosine(37)-N6)-threonylcarbamoyltransferase complex ATPase subunit type 1 TsaE [Brumimicrobium aurantiacum]